MINAHGFRKNKNDMNLLRGLQKIRFVPLFFLTSFAFRKPDFGPSLILHFKVYVHGEPMQLNKKYRNPFGEIYEISRFRLYIGNIKPAYTDKQTKVKKSSSYQLIDFSDSSTTFMELPATTGTCNGVEFELGVDSADQNLGAQSGQLDPSKGMFWTWNSGYQSFRIEGYSPFSNQPAHIIAYHIGGYRYPFSTVWKIKMNTTNDEEFKITNDYKIIVEVPVELDYFFDGPTPLHIKDISSCTTPGEMSRKISENFIGSFTGLVLTSAP